MVRCKVTNESERLAEELMSISYLDLSEVDLGQTELLMTDHLGVTIHGVATPWGRALQKWAATYDNTGNCHLVGTDIQCAAPVAVQVNGTAAHGYELDDVHDESISHPGASVFPAAFAVGTQLGCSGKEMLAAVVAGYEAIARVGTAANASAVKNSGHHPTAIFAGFGAATAAAKLYQLTPIDLCRAWGQLLSLTGGSMQFSDEPAGTAVKRLHAGNAAYNGVFSVELAVLGIDAPERAIDGRYGLLALYGHDVDQNRLWRREAAPFEIHRVSIKPYACCRILQSSIDALRATTDDFSVDPANISSIIVHAPEVIPLQHMLRRPESPMAAQYSLPYVLGAALVFGPTDYKAYAENNLADDRILAVADKVTSVRDPDIDSHYPAHFGAAVEVEYTNGERRKQTVLDSLGTPGAPLGKEAVREKITSLIDDVVTGYDVDRAIQVIESVRVLDDISDVSRLFSATPFPSVN